MTAITYLVYTVVGFAALSLLIAGIAWPAARLFKWESGRQAFKNVTQASLATVTLGGALLASGILPDRDDAIARSRQTATAREAKRCEAHAGAFVASKDFVRSRLHSPASAEFPFADYQHNTVGNCRIAIRSYVDSQNGFGAMLRTHYDAVMEYDSGRWNLISLNLK